MVAPDCATKLSPDTLGLSVAIQLKVVPTMFAVRPKLRAVPEHIDPEVALVIIGAVQGLEQTGPVNTKSKLQTFPP